MKHFWPCVGKVNISLIGGSFFQCLVKNTKILYFCRNFTFLYFFFIKNSFNTKNYRLSNQFWLCKHGVRNASFQSQSHLKWFDLDHPLIIKIEIFDPLQLNWKGYLKFFFFKLTSAIPFWTCSQLATTTWRCSFESSGGMPTSISSFRVSSKGPLSSKFLRSSSFSSGLAGF